MATSKEAARKRQYIIIAVVVVLVLVFGVLVTIFSSRDSKVPPNPEGTIGSIAGNIHNGGLFAESDGEVFFANSYADGSLYKMNLDETEVTKVSDAQAVNILAAGNYVYYFQKGVSGNQGLGGVRVPYDFVRSLKTGKEASSVARNVVVYGQLVKDTLFLMGYDKDDNLQFWRVETDGSGTQLLADYTINPAAAAGSVIYYNGTTNDHYLYSLNTQNNVSTLMVQEDMWYPIVDGSYVYYLSLKDDYQLRRYSFTDGSILILSAEGDRVESFNEGYGYIYYQTMGDDPHLVMERSDGTDRVTIANGIYNSLNLTSRYLYFKEYGSDRKTYHSPLGTGSVSEFTAAQSAIPLVK